jgi:hypothetical protein
MKMKIEVSPGTRMKRLGPLNALEYSEELWLKLRFCRRVLKAEKSVIVKLSNGEHRRGSLGYS